MRKEIDKQWEIKVEYNQRCAEIKKINKSYKLYLKTQTKWPSSQKNKASKN